MIVALRASERHPQPSVRKVIHAIGRVDRQVFFRLRPTLGRHHAQAVVAGRDLLPRGRLGQQVSGQLFAGELVEGKIRVEGLDHVVAIRPIRDRLIAVKPNRVGVANQIEPEDRHAFAVVRRGQQSVD